MVKEFRDFLMRGNVVDLAVAVVIGTAFGVLVTSFVNDVLLQFIAAIIGKPDFSSFVIDVNGTPIRIGTFINVLISFIAIAAAIFFFVVKPVNAMAARRAKTAAATPAEPTNEEKLLAEIRDLLATR
jgi:large conductance mechanosensitive channel